MLLKSNTGKLLTVLSFVVVSGWLSGCVGELKQDAATDVIADAKPEDQTAGDATTAPGDVLDTPSDQGDLTPLDTKDDGTEDLTARDTNEPDSTDVIDLEPDVPPVPFCDANVQDLAFDELMDVYPALMCEFWARCGSTLPLGFGVPELTLEACIAHFPGFFDEATRQAVASGTIQYSTTNAAQCMRTVCTMGCDNDGDLQSQSCDLVFQGTTPLGQICYADDECVSGGGCSACGGLCEARCPYCPAGQTCDWNTNSCVLLKKDGQICNGSSSQCEPQLYCKGAAENGTWVYRCTPRHPDTQACSYDEECLLNSFCNLAQAAGYCQAKFGTQQSCTADNQCRDNLACVLGPNGAGQCLAERHGLPAGTPCNPTADTCAWPNVCVPNDGSFICGPQLPSGSGCVEDENCLLGFCNDNLSCESKRPEGSTCRSDSECELFCNQDQKCLSAVRKEGEFCKRDSHCQSHECQQLTTGSQQCVPPCVRP
ncbi:MAG: hypothetical protein COW42_11420 [Deltaproteobacteria bacterium CG17_big_fil_post_rev_8_21_14_2_50_63_7]|nr:MAG: hypothetical protein COW42_11420 [Deltaproteobacteria bacterium CG17_big_fil_post_rev_8_21_14_2_50_63_7]